MDRKVQDRLRLNDISSTMLITLYCRATESRSKNPVLHDPEAVKLVNKINELLVGSTDRMYSDLARGKLNKNLVLFIALRAKKFDDYARDFLSRHPEGTIINLGCGLDTRFQRIDNGKTRFYDLDLPEVISFKRRLCGETERYHMIASSVLDPGWMEAILNRQGDFLFLAEGLFMYLDKPALQNLVTTLTDKFPGAELACEIVSNSLVNGWLKWAMKLRMQGQFHMGQSATFISGFKNSHDMEDWAPGIRLLDEWAYFDSNEPGLSMLRLLGKIPGMRNIQWVTLYRLGTSERQHIIP